MFLHVWNSFGLSLHRGSNRRCVGEDYLRMQRYKLLCKRPRAIGVAASPTQIDARASAALD